MTGTSFTNDTTFPIDGEFTAMLDRVFERVLRIRAEYVEDLITTFVISRIPVTHIEDRSYLDDRRETRIMCGATVLAVAPW